MSDYPNAMEAAEIAEAIVGPTKMRRLAEAGLMTIAIDEFREWADEPDAIQCGFAAVQSMDVWYHAWAQKMKACRNVIELRSLFMAIVADPGFSEHAFAVWQLGHLEAHRERVVAKRRKRPPDCIQAYEEEGIDT